jgi:hypothetical protein
MNILITSTRKNLERVREEMEETCPQIRLLVEFKDRLRIYVNLREQLDVPDNNQWALVLLNSVRNSQYRYLKRKALNILKTRKKENLYVAT